ncbi:MAG: winged helix-turn-helix domain-containing protein [archaeon GB-1867-035]|nr:winged helix-turn-helix domain-containing protein [Candidatus Culexmicrobium profundum]
MCRNECKHGMNLIKQEKLQETLKIFKALHCPIRWIIIKSLTSGELTTNEIFNLLKNIGEDISKSALYYHLSELRDAGIIELAEYREVGKGAPEKVWKLKIKGIKINFLEDL